MNLMQEDIIHNLGIIEKRIQDACNKSNRDRKEVKLLLATKTVSADRIKIAVEHGYHLIAENKVQEVKEKHQILSELPIEQHFIGHLQTNKVKDIMKYGISCIQSLDRISLAEKLQQYLERNDCTIDVFLQVNTSDENSKFGIAPSEARNFAKEIAQFDRLNIKGLMTIGLFSADESLVRPCFKRLRTAQLQIQELGLPNVEMKELSMGMSQDLEIAINEGATIIRVGTAIFGQRIYPDSYYWNENSNS